MKKINMNRINTKKIFSIFALIFIFFPSFNALYAQGTTQVVPDYAVLAPLPGTTQACQVRNSQGVLVPAECTDLTRYLPNAFNLAIGIAVALAFIAITIGGVMYATSDALSNKSAGKEAIENALWGLLLVIGAYLILQTINPKILDFSLTIDQFTTTNNGGTGTGGTGGGGGVTFSAPCCTYNPTTRVLNGYTLTAAQQQDNIRVIEYLHTNGVEVNNGACSTGAVTGCTNVTGLPASAQARLIAMKNACNSAFAGCFVEVTGGTEGGHASHGPNLPVVDISPNASINAYFAKTNPQAKTPVNGTQVNIPGGGTATYETTGANGRATGNHWHIRF